MFRLCQSPPRKQNAPSGGFLPNSNSLFLANSQITPYPINRVRRYLVHHKKYCRIPQAGVLRQEYGYAVLTNRNSNSYHGTKIKPHSVRGVRIPTLRFRRPTLYPVELMVHIDYSVVFAFGSLDRRLLSDGRTTVFYRASPCELPVKSLISIYLLSVFVNRLASVYKRFFNFRCCRQCFRRLF